MQIRTYVPDEQEAKGLPFFKLVSSDYKGIINPEVLFEFDGRLLPVAFEPTEPDRSNKMVGGILVTPTLRDTIGDFNRYIAEELKKDSPLPPKVLKGFIGTQFAVNMQNTVVKTDKFIVTHIIEWDQMLKGFLQPVHGWDSWEHVIERKGITPGSEVAQPPASSLNDDDYEDNDDDDEEWESDDDDDDDW